jgi:hypothetical protein
MCDEHLTGELRELIFDFFHRFSRFEFALKEADCLKSHTAGARADPSWDCFVEMWQETYRVSGAARALIAANPKQQLVGPDGHSLEFKEVQFGAQVTDLARVVRLTKTVRNNLFHGGKSDIGGWDNAPRIKVLVSVRSRVLDELADLGGLRSNYEGFY